MIELRMVDILLLTMKESNLEAMVLDELEKLAENVVNFCCSIPKILRSLDLVYGTLYDSFVKIKWRLIE